MKVRFMNHNGGGFAREIELQPGTTVGDLFVDEMGPDADPAQYLIRVNKKTETSTYQLCDGDRVTVTPTKMSGA